MTKDEYIEKITKYMADNDLEREDGLTYLDGIQDAVALARQLDEPKKAVIPEFIANDIKYHRRHGSTLRGALGSAFGQGAESDVYYWFFATNGDKNVRKYISAWDNGYEVENEIEKYVRLKGFTGTTCYLNYDVNSKDFFVDNTELDSCTKVKFTKSWLKDNWPEYEAYNNAGLLREETNEQK